MTSTTPLEWAQRVEELSRKMPWMPEYYVDLWRTLFPQGPQAERLPEITEEELMYLSGAGGVLAAVAALWIMEHPEIPKAVIESTGNMIGQLTTIGSVM